MRIPRKKLWTALTSVLCAAALMFPARTAYAAETPRAAERTEAVAAQPDSDTLFYEYLLHRAGALDRAALLAEARSKLSETDQKLYDRLKGMIAEVAAGTRTSSVFDITYENFKTTWTAAELGVADIVVNDAISKEASGAMFAKMEACFTTSPKEVMNALLADCPYELYWFDKTQNYSFGVQNLIGAEYDGSQWVMTADSTLTYRFTLKVSQNYGSGTTVNRNLHAGIDNVLSKTAEIVNAYRNGTDYEKLLGYSKEICDLVAYDDAAATNHVAYGDPWQLISVFDGNSNTNVVCEGYSKAFKYLCDLSAFKSPNVECYLVTGKLGGGTGAGPHMWNLVTMENGKRYLVDVTNSDSNGGPDYLLLKGGPADSQDPSKYTFYDYFVFTYDEEVRTLWGDEFLTLDAVDYKDAAEAPSTDKYEVGNITPNGPNVTVEITKPSGVDALLIVAAYADNGRFLRAESAAVQGTGGSVTVPLNTADAKNVKAVLLDRQTLKPFAAA